MTDTARRADVVLPAQSFIEREGSYTTGERRVQRFYPAVRPVGDDAARFRDPGPHWQPTRVVLGDRSAAAIVLQSLAADQPGLRRRAATRRWRRSSRSGRWPAGTTCIWAAQPTRTGRGWAWRSRRPAEDRRRAAGGQPERAPADRRPTGLPLVPVARLYDRGRRCCRRRCSRQRWRPGDRPQPGGRRAAAPPARPPRAGCPRRAGATRSTCGWTAASLPGVALVPRSVGLPIDEPGGRAQSR